MIKKILTYPEDIEKIKKKSDYVAEINDDIKQLIQDLKDTLKADNSGVGLSAIQIGIPQQICYINYAGEELVLINPVIKWTRRGTQPFREGCLSSPGKYAIVNRPQKVICEYTNEDGVLCEIAEGGWMSAIIQHEMDHFEGICQVYESTKEEINK